MLNQLRAIFPWRISEACIENSWKQYLDYEMSLEQKLRLLFVLSPEKHEDYQDKRETLIHLLIHLLIHSLIHSLVHHLNLGVYIYSIYLTYQFGLECTEQLIDVIEFLISNKNISTLLYHNTIQYLRFYIFKISLVLVDILDRSMFFLKGSCIWICSYSFSLNIIK